MTDSPFPMPATEQIERWRSWLDRMHPEVTLLVQSKWTYREVREIVQANPAINRDNLFHRWCVRNYADAQVSRVRRLTDRTKNTVSLVRLLTQLRQHNRRISREWHTSLYGSGQQQQQIADLSFSNLAGGGAAYLSRAAVDVDLDRLEHTAAAINEFANKRIAHLTGDDVPTPKLRELHESVDAVEEIYIKYRILLTAEGWSTVLPSPLYDWKTIFRQPWIPAEEP